MSKLPAEGAGLEIGRVLRFSGVLLGVHSPPMPRASLPRLCFVPCAVGRKQFMRFEWANYAAEALGCEYEELNTATFKHHLRQIIQQMTFGPSQRGLEDEETSSGTWLLPLWVSWAPSGPAPGDTPTFFNFFFFFLIKDLLRAYAMKACVRCRGSHRGRKGTLFLPGQC